MFFNRTERALNHAHSQWNGLMCHQSSPGLSSLVRSRLKAHQVLISDGDILVTEAGFVTMAIHADHAVLMQNTLVAPGVDHQGQRGYLVLHENAAPFHSLARSAVDAFDEAMQAKDKADQLLAVFGNKRRLRRAAQQAPWYLLSTTEDFERSGLCRWGSESFLQRLGLLGFARRVGLPRLLLRLAGPYGDRLTARSLLRHGLIRTRRALASQ